MNFAGIFAAWRTTAWIGVLCGACLFPSGRLFAQAPPGPMTPSHPLPPPPKAPPGKSKPAVESRSTLAGFWKLNKEESDDPKNKVESARKSKGEPDGGLGGPRVGVGYPGPGGGPNGPYGGSPGMGDSVDEASLRLEEFVRPAFSQTIELKNNELDTTNEQDTKLVIFTDGRKLPKQKDKSPQQISAHWDGAKLVTDEKSPQGKQASRTLELSFDGKQIYETWRVEGSRSASDIIIRYVYDAAVDEHR
jgi:hypothetical protein